MIDPLDELLKQRRKLTDRVEETVFADKWDRDDYQKVREEVDALPVATQALLDVTKTARPEMADLFNLLHKAVNELLDPDEIRDDHRINRAVNEEVLDLPQFREFRRFTRGDLVGAAMGVVQIEPEVEIVFDREKLRQKQADKLQELRDELRDKLDELIKQIQQQQPQQPGEGEGEEGEESQGSGQGQGEEGEDEGQGQGGSQSLQDEINNLKDAIEAAERALKEGLDSDALSMRAQLSGAISDALNEARMEGMVSRSWGMSRGQLRRLPAKERLERAKKMNNPRFRDIAEHFGRLRHLAMAVKEQTIPEIPHSVVGVTLGDDLAHLMPSELARMDDPDLEWQWLADYAEHRLMQYRLEGTEKLGRGGIVLLEDGSASMSGEREKTAKAIMLVLLDIAKCDGREFHLVHFGSHNEFKILSFTKPEDFTLDNVIEAAEIFFSSGPLRIDQRLVTPDGWKPIGSVEVGDQVFGPDGLPCNVVGVYPQGELEDMYRVTFKDGESVVCDGGHLWTVLDRTVNGVSADRATWKTLSLRSIIDGGITANHNGYRFSVPVSEPIQLPGVNLPLDPYLMGYLLGNGGFTNSSPRISSHWGDEVEWMKVLPSGISANDHERRSGLCPSYSLAAGDRGTVTENGNPITSALRDLGLWGLGGEDKYIPEIYLWASIDQRWALLQGLLDSDGNIDGVGRATFNTHSPKLLDGARQLVESLGAVGKVTVSPKGRSHMLHGHMVTQKSDTLKLGISLPGSRNPFRLTRKAERFITRHNTYLRSIVSVEPVEAAECVCIKVDREDGLFLTEGMVVTHNTAFDTPLEEGMKILKTEHALTGRVSSDLIMLTDGYASLTDEFLEQFAKDLAEIEGVCWAVNLGHDVKSEPVNTISSGKVFSLDDLTNKGRELSQLLKGIQ